MRLLGHNYGWFDPSKFSTASKSFRLSSAFSFHSNDAKTKEEHVQSQVNKDDARSENYECCFSPLMGGRHGMIQLESAVFKQA